MPSLIIATVVMQPKSLRLVRKTDGKRRKKAVKEKADQPFLVNRFPDSVNRKFRSVMVAVLSIGRPRSLET